jgi:hypothetical protein
MSLHVLSLQLAASEQQHGCKTVNGNDPIALNDDDRRSFANRSNKKRKRRKVTGVGRCRKTAFHSLVSAMRFFVSATSFNKPL